MSTTADESIRPSRSELVPDLSFSYSRRPKDEASDVPDHGCPATHTSSFSVSEHSLSIKADVDASDTKHPAGVCL